jgi:mono/diheme cytochrome c family protein
MPNAPAAPNAAVKPSAPAAPSAAIKGSEPSTTNAVPRFVLAAVLLVAVAAACGKTKEPLPPDAADRDPSLLAARMEYRSICAVCHGKDGAGASALFPPLQGSPWTTYAPEAMIRVVLHGLEGPLTVNDKEFMNKMAPLGGRLSDAQIAEVLTYVRKSWGNTGSAVSADEVARVRAAFSGRETAWTAKELEPLLVPQAASAPDS